MSGNIQSWVGGLKIGGGDCNYIYRPGTIRLCSFRLGLYDYVAKIMTMIFFFTVVIAITVIIPVMLIAA